MSVATDIASMETFALQVWRGLTIAQKTALRRAGPAYFGPLCAHGNGRCLAALANHGLVVGIRNGPTPLTARGRLVRERGLEAEAAEAKRRYSRRKGAP